MGLHIDAYRREHTPYNIHAYIYTHINMYIYTPSYPHHSKTQKLVDFSFSRFFLCSIWDALKLPLNNASGSIQYSRILEELGYIFGGLDSAMVGDMYNLGTGKAHTSELSGTFILLKSWFMGMLLWPQQSKDLAVNFHLFSNIH